MNRRNWQETEIRILKDNITVVGVKGCADKLNRSFKSVWAKAQRLGILPGDQRWWSDTQKNELADKFGKIPTLELSNVLGISISSLYHQAQRMGLKHSRWWTEAELNFLKNNYHVLSSKEIGEVLGRTDSNIQGAARKHGLSNVNLYPKERYCADCGKLLANKYMKPIYCKDCAAKHRKAENNPQWKGGVSSLYKLIQRNLWAVWKKPILERDKFRCKLCASRDMLEVHHIKPLVEIRDEVISENPHLEISNYNDRVKLAEIIVARHSLDEGITLCQSCHRAYHIAKRSELLGTPNGKAEGNQQPSWSNVIQLVDRKVQRLTGEDSQPISPTRALRTSPLKV